MVRVCLALVVLTVVAFTTGCTMCCHPYDYCGPVFDGPYATGCDWNARAASIHSGTIAAGDDFDQYVAARPSQPKTRYATQNHGRVASNEVAMQKNAPHKKPSARVAQTHSKTRPVQNRERPTQERVQPPQRVQDGVKSIQGRLQPVQGGSPPTQLGYVPGSERIISVTERVVGAPASTSESSSLAANSFRVQESDGPAVIESLPTTGWTAVRSTGETAIR